MQDSLDREVHALLAGDLERQEGNGWQVCGAVEDIIYGERDGETLTIGVDPNSAALVVRLLELLRGSKSQQMRSTLKLATTLPRGEGIHMSYRNFPQRAITAKADLLKPGFITTTDASGALNNSVVPMGPAMLEVQHKSKLMKKIHQLNGEDEIVTVEGLALSDKELKHLSELVESIRVHKLHTEQDVTSAGVDAAPYSNITAQQLAALDKMLMWPTKQAFPALDLFVGVFAHTEGRGCYTATRSTLDSVLGHVLGHLVTSTGGGEPAVENAAVFQRVLLALINVSASENWRILLKGGREVKMIGLLPIVRISMSLKHTRRHTAMRILHTHVHLYSRLMLRPHSSYSPTHIHAHIHT
jgi:hypothetical protein